MEIKSLAGIAFETIPKAFSKAFDDYIVQISDAELQTMLHRRGFEPELSFAAFIDNELVSFTLNGIGLFGGLKTAYDTGTGTIKEFRGQGLATQIFTHSIPHLKEAGVEQYLLEVLQSNTKAKSIYEKQGFEVSREFNYFVQETEKIHTVVKALDTIEIVQTNRLDENLMARFYDFEPSWQNNFEAIARMPEDFIILGAYNKQILVGYAILQPTSGDITQLAIDKNYRRRGIGSALLNALLSLNKHANLKVINADIKCSALTHFLEANSIVISGKQFEMIRPI